MLSLRVSNGRGIRLARFWRREENGEKMAMEENLELVVRMDDVDELATVGGKECRDMDPRLSLVLSSSTADCLCPVRLDG